LVEGYFPKRVSDVTDKPEDFLDGELLNSHPARLLLRMSFEAQGGAEAC
jgi:hypothetical protein